MVALRFRMQGCAIAGKLGVLMCLSGQGVVEARELHGTVGSCRDELGRHNLSVHIGITGSGRHLEGI